jgi:hypothetical protein
MDMRMLIGQRAQEFQIQLNRGGERRVYRASSTKYRCTARFTSFG